MQNLFFLLNFMFIGDPKNIFVSFDMLAANC